MIVGASGGVGLETVRLALKAGHSVRALARSATSICLRDPRLERSWLLISYATACLSMFGANRSAWLPAQGSRKTAKCHFSSHCSPSSDRAISKTDENFSVSSASAASRSSLDTYVHISFVRDPPCKSRSINTRASLSVATVFTPETTSGRGSGRDQFARGSEGGPG